MQGFYFIFISFILALNAGACTPSEDDTQEQECELDNSCDDLSEPSAPDESDSSDASDESESTDASDPEGNACSNDADCAYNGICTSGTCDCTTPWRGSNCEELTMGRVDKSVYGYRQGFPFTTSWGASAQFDNVSGKYVMLVSEYVEECANWGWNSTVVLATSENPEGPYEKEFTLFGVMSHEAMLARGPSGEWVVYFTAVEQSNNRPRMGSDGYAANEVCTRADIDSPCDCPGDPDKGSNDPTWMSFTSTPLNYESWATPVKVFDPGSHFTDFVPDGSRAESIDANFNGVIRNDGSFVGLWRTWQCVGDLVAPWSDTLDGANPDTCFSVPHAINASDWEDSSTYQIEAQKRDLEWLFPEQYVASPTERLALGIEDPMVYVDNRSPPVYHAIFHEMFVPSDNVSHAYSTDGVQWTYTGTVFDTGSETNMPMVTFTDGEQAGLACERPQLLIENGVLTHIIIGGIPTGLGEDPEFTSESDMTIDDQVEETGWPGGATMVIPLVGE